jgi:hypothetical protein
MNETATVIRLYKTDGPEVQGLKMFAVQSR